MFQEKLLYITLQPTPSKKWEKLRKKVMLYYYIHISIHFTEFASQNTLLQPNTLHKRSIFIKMSVLVI